MNLYLNELLKPARPRTYCPLLTVPRNTRSDRPLTRQTRQPDTYGPHLTLRIGVCNALTPWIIRTPSPVRRCSPGEASGIKAMTPAREADCVRFRVISDLCDVEGSYGACK